MAGDGYSKAGFQVIGVDVNPQPDYPYPFYQIDAFSGLARILMEEADVIHASPPCQLFTRAKHLRDAQGGVSSSVDLLTPMLTILHWQRKPWVVENVENAKSLMPGAVRVCGSAFGLGVQRHRLFLSNRPLRGTPCHHERFPLDPITRKPRPWGVYHVPGDSIPAGGRTARDAEHGRELFGMSRSLPWHSLKEGFPPIYTEWIGEQLVNALEVAA